MHNRFDGAFGKKLPAKIVERLVAASRSSNLGSVGSAAAVDVTMEWQRISTAPFDRDLEVAVIDYDGIHALVFPCRRIMGGWINAKTETRLRIFPTHWREWQLTPERTTLKNA